MKHEKIISVALIGILIFATISGCVPNTGNTEGFAVWLPFIALNGIILALLLVMFVRNRKVLNERNRMMRELEAAAGKNEFQLDKLSMVLKSAKIGLLDIEIDKNNPTNPQNRTVFSEEYLKLLGYSNEEEFLKDLGSTEALVHPEDQADAFRAFTEHLLDKTGNTPFDVEQRLRKKTGEYAWFRTVGEAIRDEDGNPLQFVNVVMDMTDTKKLLKEAKDAAEESEFQLTKLNLVIKSAKIALWEKKAVYDDWVNQENIVMYSDEFRHMLGYEDETDFPNVVGSWSNRLHPDDKERSLNALESHLLDKTGKTPFDIEYRLIKKNGEIAYFHATGETLRDEHGNIVRTAGALIDVTESKRLIREIKTKIDEVKAANRAKSEFLSNMSHEIRTPMNAIIGMTYIGKNASDINQKNYSLQKIENASQHLLSVINDILDMSKIEANKLELSYEEFDFERMLQRVVNMLAFPADEKHQELRVYIDHSVPQMLIGDDQRLAQVLTNLLGNAIKFTPENGTIKLETRSLGKTDGEYTIQITVKDTGIGISAEQQKHLFQSFQQAEAGTARKFGGTGLGLSISKNIVEMMGGEIWVESELDKGASFAFTFKAKRGKKKSASLSELGINWDSITIMVVDDDPQILDYFVDVIQSFGATCDTALSGEEALAQIGKKGLYHIYFIDWKMPGMDGIKLASEIKEKDADDKSVAVMISAAEWSGIAEDARKAGVDRFLSKPLFPSAIADAITEAIGLRSTDGEIENDYSGIFKGYKILLAEDMEINREIIAMLIEPTLLKMDCAEDGLKAAAMFQESPDAYDLILMDVQMPKLDGYETTRVIRGLENTKAKTIPIIAMTANVFREDIEKCLEAGMNDHIGKPVDFEDFIGTLKKYLFKERADHLKRL